MSAYEHRTEGNVRPIFTNVPGRGTRTYVAQVETYVKEVRRPKYTVIPVKMDTSTERGIVNHSRPREVDNLISKILTEVNGSPASYSDLSYTEPGRGNQWGQHIIPVKVKTRDDYGTDHRYGASPPKDTVSNYRVEYEYSLPPRKPEIGRSYRNQWDDYNQPFHGDYGDRGHQWGNLDMKSEKPRDYGGHVSGNSSSSPIYGQPWQRDNQTSNYPYQEDGGSDNLSPKKLDSPRIYRVNDDQQGNNPIKAQTRYQYAVDPTLVKPESPKNRRSPRERWGGPPLSPETSMDNRVRSDPSSKSAGYVYEYKPDYQSPRKGDSPLSQEALTDSIGPNNPWSKSSGHDYGYDYVPYNQSKGGSSLSPEVSRDNKVSNNSWKKPSSHVYDNMSDNQFPKKHVSPRDSEASEIRPGYRPVKRAPVDYGAPNHESHYSSSPSYDNLSANEPPLKSKTLTEHGVPDNRWSPLSPKASKDNKVSNNPWSKSSSHVYDYMPDNQSPKKYGSPMDSEGSEYQRGYQPFSRAPIDHEAPNNKSHHPSSPSYDPANQSLSKLETLKDHKVPNSGWSPLKPKASMDNRASNNSWNKSSGHVHDLMPDNQSRDNQSPKKYGLQLDDKSSKNRLGYQPISQAPADYVAPNNESHHSSPPSYGQANQTPLKSETPKDLKVANNRWSPSSPEASRDNRVSNNPWSKMSGPVDDYMPDNQSPKKYGSVTENKVSDRREFQPISRAPVDYGAPNNLQQLSSPSPSYDHSPTNDPPLKSEAPNDHKAPNIGETTDNYSRFSNIKPLNRWGSSYNPPLNKAQLPTKLKTTKEHEYPNLRGESTPMSTDPPANLSNQPLHLPNQPPNNMGTDFSSKKHPPPKSEPQRDHTNAPKKNLENSENTTQPNHWNSLSSRLYDHQSPRIDNKHHQAPNIDNPRAPQNPYSEPKGNKDNYALSKPKTDSYDHPPKNYGGTNEKRSGSFKTSPPNQTADLKGNVADNMSEAMGQLSVSPRGVPEKEPKGSYVPETGKSRLLVPPPVVSAPKQDKTKGLQDIDSRDAAERYGGYDFPTSGSLDGEGKKNTITCKEAVQKYGGLAVPN